MTSAATRARWLELGREKRAARDASDLLDLKREVLLRELQRRYVVEDSVRRHFAESLEQARLAIAEARLELGRSAVEAASLAVRDAPLVDAQPHSLVGIALPNLEVRLPPARPSWAPGGTSESLDRARSLFLAAASVGTDLGREKLAISNLEKGLAQTNRRWNALDTVILPRLARELTGIAETLAEEERDDDFRRRRASSNRRQQGITRA